MWRYPQKKEKKMKVHLGLGVKPLAAGNAPVPGTFWRKELDIFPILPKNVVCLTPKVQIPLLLCPVERRPPQKTSVGCYKIIANGH
jgi:hypothetical protein